MHSANMKIALTKFPLFLRMIKKTDWFLLVNKLSIPVINKNAKHLLHDKTSSNEKLMKR